MTDAPMYRSDRIGSPRAIREELLQRWRSARAELERAERAVFAFARACMRERWFDLSSAYAAWTRVRELQRDRASARERFRSASHALFAQDYGA